MENITHAEAVRLLKTSGPMVELRVQHRALQREKLAQASTSAPTAAPPQSPSPSTVEEIVLIKVTFSYLHFLFYPLSFLLPPSSLAFSNSLLLLFSFEFLLLSSSLAPFLLSLHDMC